MKSTLESNGVLISFYCVYLLLLYMIFSSDFVFVFSIHLFLIVVAFTPLGEFIMRMLNHTKKIRTTEDKNYLEPLFQEVYEDAMKYNSNLKSNVELFINEDKTPNAFACASHTICVTRGAIYTFSKEELQGVLAHELGHLSNNDTRVSMIFFIGNLLFLMVALLFNFFYSISCSIIYQKSGNSTFLVTILNYIKYAISSLIGFVVSAIFSLNSRICEVKADKFASDVGYGMNLKEALEVLKKIDNNSKMGLMEKIYATHPDLDIRISKIEQLEQIL